MFPSLELVFQTLKHMFQTLELKFQTLKHIILRGEKTFPPERRIIFLPAKEQTNSPEQGGTSICLITYLCPKTLPFQKKSVYLQTRINRSMNPEWREVRS